MSSDQTIDRKRGRPKSSNTLLLESPIGNHSPPGSHRTKVNWAFMLTVLGLIRTAGEDSQRIAWGCTASEIESGRKTFPKGWTTAAPEIGRYLEGCNDGEKQAVLRVILEARGRCLSWNDIATHFRRLRLGQRSGNRDSLTSALCRTVDAFWKQFPKTSADEVLLAIDETRAAVLRATETKEPALPAGTSKAG